MQEEGNRPERVLALRSSPLNSPPEAQLLITMGCGDECPYVPGVRRDDWPLEDPKGQPIERVRAYSRRNSRSRGGVDRSRGREIGGQRSTRAQMSVLPEEGEAWMRVLGV